MFPPLPEIIHKALLADRREPTGLLHASSASWQPLRFTQLGMIYPQDETDYGSLVTMKLGTLTHDWLQKYLIAEGVSEEWELLESEWDVTEWLPEGWTGTLDYLFRHIPSNTNAITDLKTIKPEAVSYLGDRPKPEHTTQVSCYHAAVTNYYSQHSGALKFPKLDHEISVCYLPKSKDSKQQTILPIIKTAPAELSAWANMVGIKRQVDEYLAEYKRTGEVDNKFLAPMPEPEAKIGWNKATNQWDVTMRPSWTEEFIGARFGEELCPRTPSQKIGNFTLDLHYIARPGIVQPEDIPTPSKEEIDRRRR